MKDKKLIADPAGWKTTHEELKFSNAYLEIVEEQVRTPSRRKPVSWTVAHRKCAAVIAPRLPDGRYLLIQQERIPIRKTIWEFPAGQVDDSYSPDEANIRATARRELVEETGYDLARRSRMKYLGIFYTSPGFTTEHAWLFLAPKVCPAVGGAQHDEGEAILGIKAVTPSQLLRMIARDEIQDANTLACCCRLQAMRLFV